MTNGAVVPDPLADLDVPFPLPPCIGPNPSPIVGGTTTLSAGRYCGGLDIQGGATVNFDPGIYFIDDGDLKVVGNSTIVGDCVTFVLTGSPQNSIGSVQMNTGVQVQMTAPTSGEFAGVLFYQDRDALPPTPPCSKPKPNSKPSSSRSIH